MYVNQPQRITLFSVDNYTRLPHKFFQYEKMRVMFPILPVSKHITDSLRIVDVPPCAADSAPRSLVLYLHTPTVLCSGLLTAD